MTLSAHKIGGPKGMGALVLAEGVLGPEPLLRGGGQELGRRAGTENVAGIAGFGAAAKTAMAALRKTPFVSKACEIGLKMACGTPPASLCSLTGWRGCRIPLFSRFPE